jgi:hypothetical protein
MTSNLSAEFSLPAWVPNDVRLYLDHTGVGVPFRELARRQGAHASTVMRQVRRCEARREDPLVDEALALLGGRTMPPANEDDPAMTAAVSAKAPLLDEATLSREGRRILRRMAEPGAVLAIAPDLDKAVVLRDFPDGQQARTAVVDRAVAQAFALKDWIACRKKGRVTTYDITSAGRAALRRMIDESDLARQAQHTGMAEAPMPFASQHRIWDERQIEEGGATRKIRYNMAESPLAVLGRRRDKDGKPFLENELIRAAERLREDFELAQMGPRVAQNWERFLTAGDRGGFRPDAGHGEGPGRARDRVAAALRDLGPGLGDVALRVCCFLEGIETAEKRMGWAARSGKIVLRIALQRLRRHYEDCVGDRRNFIG